MSRHDIRVDDLKPVVANMGPSFQTMDVADDENLRAKYPELIAADTYNSCIGGALSYHHLALAIGKVGGKKPRGMIRRKQEPPATFASSQTHAISGPSSRTAAADDHLLAVALRHQAGSPYATSRLLVVHHPEDRRCGQVYAGYRALLCDADDTLRAIALDRLVDAWSRIVDQSARAAWLEPFRTRYLDLELSAG